MKVHIVDVDFDKTSTRTHLGFINFHLDSNVRTVRNLSVPRATLIHHTRRTKFNDFLTDLLLYWTFELDTLAMLCRLRPSLAAAFLNLFPLRRIRIEVKTIITVSVVRELCF